MCMRMEEERTGQVHAPLEVDGSTACLCRRVQRLLQRCGDESLAIANGAVIRRVKDLFCWSRRAKQAKPNCHAAAPSSEPAGRSMLPKALVHTGHNLHVGRSAVAAHRSI